MLVKKFMQRLRRAIVLTAISLVAASALVTVPLASTSAAACPADMSQSVCDACTGIGTANGDCTSKGATQVSNVVKGIVNILSAIVGVAAIIMIIISGLKYITSGGDSNAVSSAKSSLIYALVGLIIVAMAQFIVHLVFHVTG